MITTIATAVVLTVLLAYILYQSFISPLAAFPGPFFARFTKLWRAQATYRGHWHRDLVGLHRKYGNVVRIAPNELSVGDPDAFKIIYRAGNAFPKAPSYSVVQGSRPFDLTGERNEKIHSEQRRLVARPYSMESMRHLEPQIDVLIKDLVTKLDEQADSNRDIDLGDWLQLFAFDVIGAVSFSKPFGFVSKGTDDGMFSRIEKAMGSTMWVMHTAWFFRLHQRYIMPIFGNCLALNDRNGFFFQYANTQVQSRKKDGGSDRDIVGQLFKAQENKAEISDLAIAFMMTSNVFAGSDTTSIGLRSIILHLIQHPQVLERLRKEMLARLKAGQLSESMTFEQVEAWPYLQAVMYEALRLHAPAAFNLDREVPKEGLVIQNHYVPANTVVGSSPWVIHRIPEVWGEDVEEFNPDRWMDPARATELKRFFFAFGGGSRTCIGRNISWLEMSKLVPTLLLRYDLHVEDDLRISDNFAALVFLKGLQVRLSRRGY